MSLFCLDNTGASNNLNVTMNTHIYINIGQLFRISGEFIWRKYQHRAHIYFKTNRDKKKNTIWNTKIIRKCVYHLSLVAVWYAITRLIFHTYPIQQVIRWLVNANQNTRKLISSEWFDLNIIHTQKKNKNSNYNCGWMKTFRFKLLSHTKTVCFTLNSNHTFRALFSVNKDVCVPLEREIKSRSFQQYFIFFYRYTAVCVRQRKLFRMFVLWDYTAAAAHSMNSRNGIYIYLGMEETDWQHRFHFNNAGIHVIHTHTQRI